MSQCCTNAPRTGLSPPAAIDLQKQLLSSPYWSVRQLVCHVGADCVIVRGTVPSYYLKQVAQSLAARVMGLSQIQNDIHVESK
jgi:hypothetical protein